MDDGHDPEDPDSPRAAAAITGICHHVALLRTPELVVDYLEGPPPPEGGTEWAGVFRADDDQDKHFAPAEPPTHDPHGTLEAGAVPEGKQLLRIGAGARTAELDGRPDVEVQDSVGRPAVTAIVSVPWLSARS